MNVGGRPDSARLEIVRETPDTLGEYARVPIAFEAGRVMDVTATADGNGFALAERALPRSVWKDYDALPGDGPRSWPERFDMSGWSLFAAYVDGRRAGGAALVMRAPEIDLLDGRDDLALLWDIRVVPAMRQLGVGTALLRAVEIFASEAGARWLKVETQDINVPACRFYMRNGFELRAVHRHAYRDLPHEVQLLWYKPLAGTA